CKLAKCRIKNVLFYFCCYFLRLIFAELMHEQLFN
ncbi:MAG: hypothetical protein ACI8VI_001198, partial [Granulosicoccus sp.]